LNTPHAHAVAVEKQHFQEAFKASASTMPGIFAWGLVAGGVIPDLVLSGTVINLTWENPKLLAGIGATVFFVATLYSAQSWPGWLYIPYCG
jgi:hypothetical protein